MKYRKKLNKIQRQADYKLRLAYSLKGDGRYVYENNTAGDLILPKTTKDGVRMVGKGRRFEGDSYYLSLVRTNQLRLVEQLDAPSDTPVEVITEERIETMPAKLILDQPDRATAEGTVEQVLVEPTAKPKRLTETKKQQQPQPEVLLTEDPMDGVEILLN